MGVRDDELVVLQVARFHPVKDHATALRAMARVAEQLPRARLVLVGKGALRPAAEALARDLEVGQRVSFLSSREDVDALLPTADVFLLSSLSEGNSVTLLEAMATRLPIVATSVGGTPKVVDHGRNGLLCQRQDVAGLTQNLLLLLRDPDLRRRMGEAGRNRLLQHFNQKAMHDHYANLYNQMLGRGENG